MRVTSHTEPKRPSRSLEIDEDLRFQSKMWRIERIGWWSIAAILAAAAVGLFGRGPVSRATLLLADPGKANGEMTLQYEWLARASSESQFVISGDPEVGESRTFSLWLSGEYLNDAEVLRITPDPESQDLVSKGIRYRFRREDGPQTVMFRVKPERPGTLSGALRINDGPPITFHQWVFP